MFDIEETNIGAHAILVTKEGKIILQQRNIDPQLINSGKISMFGGTLKKNEPLIDGLLRELEEELELKVNKLKIIKLGKYEKTRQLDGQDHTIYVFVIKNIALDELTLHEGKRFFCDFPEKALINKKLTRIARLALEDYLKRFVYK